MKIREAKGCLATHGLLCKEDWGLARPEGHPELKDRLSRNRDVGGGTGPALRGLLAAGSSW